MFINIVRSKGVRACRGSSKRCHGIGPGDKCLEMRDSRSYSGASYCKHCVAQMTKEWLEDLSRK